MHDDVEVSRGTASRSGFAFVLEAELLPGRDARRDLHRELPFTRNSTRATARRARLGDDLAGALALRAGAGDGEEPLLRSNLSLTAAHPARGRRRSGGRARAMAGLAGLLPWNLNRGLHALG